jgi:hypothetical protein
MEAAQKGAGMGKQLILTAAILVLGCQDAEGPLDPFGGGEVSLTLIAKSVGDFEFNCKGTRLECGPENLKTSTGDESAWLYDNDSGVWRLLLWNDKSASEEGSGGRQ